MDIERLNKTQVILLTLLISFVTSIATGIATVSLMEKAPTDVTRVISRIIEKPIETVVPGEKEVITKEHTVVVSELEGISKAVATIAPSMVRIYLVPPTKSPVPEFKGIGLIVSTDGIVVADSRIVERGKKYVARLFDGAYVAIQQSTNETEQGFFRLVPDVNQTLPTLTPVVLESFSSLTLGSTVVALGGDASTRIAPGVISELVPAVSLTAASRIRTTVDGSLLSLGSPLVTLDGKVIGMPEELGSQVFLSLKEKE